MAHLRVVVLALLDRAQVTRDLLRLAAAREGAERLEARGEVLDVLVEVQHGLVERGHGVDLLFFGGRVVAVAQLRDV